MSQPPSVPDAAPFQPPSAAAPKRLFKRYFIVTLFVASWCAVWLFLDGIYDLWIFVVFPIFPPLAGLAIYLLGGLVVSARKDDGWRILSVILGPLAAIIVTAFAAAVAGSLGLTPDRLLFLKQRDKFLARAAEPGSISTPVVGSLRMSGFWWACTSQTLVVYDPSHRIAVPPAQRDDEWSKRVAEIVSNSKCGNGSTSISRLEGDFYAIRLN